MTDYDDGNARDLAAQRQVLEAARALLAAITPVLEAMDHTDGPQTVHMGKATVDALFAAYAQATAAGIGS